MDVTAKELKQRLGQYLAAVEQGKTVRVTKRGKVVAELTQPAFSARDKLDRLIEQGKATRGSRKPLPPYTPPSNPIGFSGSDFIIAEREAERTRWQR